MRELMIAYLNKIMSQYKWDDFKYWFGVDKVMSFKYMTDQQILDYYTDIIRSSSMPRAG